jgi:hypothetical protein
MDEIIHIRMDWEQFQRIRLRDDRGCRLICNLSAPDEEGFYSIICTTLYEDNLDPKEALLGLATTEAMLREVIARLLIHGDPKARFRATALAEALGSLTDDERGFRTVDR